MSLASDQAGRDTLRALSDKLDNAIHGYAHNQAEDYGQPDWHNAHEYRDDGYAIGEQAFAMADDDREDHVETAVSTYPETARYLVACAAYYRLAELVRDGAAAQRVAA